MTQLERVEAAGLGWWIRPGSSDWKAVEEVAVRRAYFTRRFRVEAGERWLDAGANVGAFSVVAAAAGADVAAYEPAADSADVARRNLAENGLRVRVQERAVTRGAGWAELRLGRSEWRHSLLRGESGYAVPCTSFAKAIEGRDAAKLDIEGAEIEILTDPDVDFGALRKLVFEWHFDYQPATDVYLAVLERLRSVFDEVQGRKVPAGVQYAWFPPSALVRCQR